MESVHYQGVDGVVNWCGTHLSMNEEYQHFMHNDVATRLHDQPGSDDFKTCLRGLVSTGFAQNSLDAILAAEVPEQRDWAIGEAFAEAWLSKKHGVVWPWNLERDKRTPKASLPGADLIGFVEVNNETRLLIGEVKTSSDTNTPPKVMNGRTGMIHQILCWLQPRCENTDYESQFKAAIGLLLQSGNKKLRDYLRFIV